MKFPLITNRSQFDDIISSKKEMRLKTEQVGDYTYDIISYMVMDTDTFDCDLSRECRGIMFDHNTGEVVSRPFHKFFNVNERESTKVDNIGPINCITNKLDGSLAIPVLVGNKIIWKTKKSFYSDVAININRFYNSGGHSPEANWKHRDIINYNPMLPNYPLHEDMHRQIMEYLKVGMTPLFEYVGPGNKIVLEYSYEKLRLLASRNNYNGNYIINHNNIVMEDVTSVQEIITSTIDKEDIEGYVIMDDNDFYKIKTSWYVLRHRAVGYISKKEIINMVIDEQLDDLIGIILENNDFDKVKKIQELSKEVTSYIVDIITKADKLVDENKDKTDLELVNLIKDNQCLLFVTMRKRRNAKYETRLKQAVKMYFKNKYKNEMIV